MQKKRSLKALENKEKYHLTFTPSPRENLFPKILILSLGQRSQTFLGKPGLCEVNAVKFLWAGKFPLRSTNSPSVQGDQIER